VIGQKAFMFYLLTVLLVFFAVSIGLIGSLSLWRNVWRGDQMRFGERIDLEFRPVAPTQSANSLFKSLDVIAREVGNSQGSKPGFHQRLDRIIMQAGLSFSIHDLILYSVTMAIVSGVAMGSWQHNLWIALTAAFVGANIPVIYVWLKWRIRLDALRHQLPDAFDSMARSLRAGQTLEQALQSIAREFGSPLGPEFSFCFEQQNLGLPTETAYRELAQRTGLMEVRIMVVAILVQQQSGGNLAELLDKLATVVRDRFRMLGKIRTLTAESKFQSLLLMALPPLMFVVLFVVKKSYIIVLLDHPSVLIAVVLMQIVGALWIHRIANFRY
jgi:tight adherence protein B